MSSNPSILVTGGAGYIGSHACKALKMAGYIPVAYDNLIYGHQSAVKWGPLEIGDISDRCRLNEVIKKYNPLAVLHFAAYAHVGESVLNPGKYYRNNVAGTLTLLEAMRDNAVNKIIFSSTCATYGLPKQVSISENHPQNPINPYGSSKLMIEHMLQDFNVAHGLKSISLRYFNAAGADPEGDIGESHNPETHLIPIILDVAAGKSSAITVFGNDYDTPDGTCIRDYIHVTDLAEAHVKALKLMENHSGRIAYNLSNGEGHSVYDVIKMVEQLTGKRLKIKISSRRSGDPPRLVGDARLAIVDLRWTPKNSSLENIIKTAMIWHQAKKF